jgi:hypothetical protein
VAVSVYCSKFLDGFKVLRTRTIQGTLVLNDFSFYSNGISVSGSTCRGANGYSDIGPGTNVTIANANGQLIEQTTLGAGHGNEYLCIFEFTATLTEGERSYAFEISHRGKLSSTFDELVSTGFKASLGND